MRFNIPDVIFLLVLIFLGVISVIGLLNAKNNKHLISIQYDCRLSEISPDFPQQVKQQCRMLNTK